MGIFTVIRNVLPEKNTNSGSKTLYHLGLVQTVPKGIAAFTDNQTDHHD
jgi:hypothetical protein